MRNIHLYFFCFTMMSLTMNASVLRAEDSVLSTIKDAIKQYENGNYTEAASNLDYASQLVRQKKSEQMKEIFPEPTSGWTAGTINSQALGSEVLGGGLTMSREYKKNETTIKLEIMSDSPVLQSVLMMTNNSVFASAGGGKLETLKGNKAIVKYDKDDTGGEIYIVVDSRFVVVVKGRHISREDMIRFSELVDYKKLATY